MLLYWKWKHQSNLKSYKDVGTFPSHDVLNNCMLPKLGKKIEEENAPRRLSFSLEFWVFPLSFYDVEKSLYYLFYYIDLTQSISPQGISRAPGCGTL